jgi:ubiquitin-conjugating enzyme E2 Q
VGVAPYPSLEIRAGDDEGSLEVVIEKNSSEHVISVNLLVSGMRFFFIVVDLLNFRADTSEYPTSHSLFCYSPDGDLSAKLQRIVDEIAEGPVGSLGCTIRALAQSVARVVSAPASKVKVHLREDTTDEEEASSDEADDFDVFDYDDDFGISPESDSVMVKIQEYVHHICNFFFSN